MQCYDVFNGDADGICALVQLRLADAHMAEPRKARLITGVKRDINLLARVNAKAGDDITVLDISARNNAKDLRRNLDAGASVFYVDHHNPGSLPNHKNLQAVIDTSPNICTSLLVNHCLEGAYKEWAIVAAFGDNLPDAAYALAKPVGYKPEHIAELKRLGQLINYNAYGRDVSDLHFAPDKLFEVLSRYENPDAFLFSEPEIVQKLETGFYDDLAKAWKGEELLYTEFNLDNDIPSPIWLLGDAAWARRISGTFGNVLANQTPDQAHAVLTHNAQGGYRVSVRAPKNTPLGADILCMKFPTGGGRAGAAGINHLPKNKLDTFITFFNKAF